MPNANVQNNTTAIVTPTPLLLSDFFRCKDNPDIAINKYFNNENDLTKEDKIVKILNNNISEFTNSDSDYNSIASFCLYKLAFFNSVKFFYYCENKNSLDRFRDLVSKTYLESDLKLKPMLLQTTFNKIFLYNNSEIFFANNVLHFVGRTFDHLIIDECTPEIFEKFLPIVSWQLLPDKKIIKVVKQS